MLVALTRRVVYLLIAAFTLNFVFSYIVVDLYLGYEFKANKELTSMWFDLFGGCAQGFNTVQKGCVPF